MFNKLEYTRKLIYFRFLLKPFHKKYFKNIKNIFFVEKIKFNYNQYIFFKSAMK